MPGDWRKKVSEYLAQRAGNEWKAAMDPGEQHVEQGHERQKAYQHDCDIQCQLAAIDGATGDCSDKVFLGMQFIFGDDDFAFGGGDFSFGHEHLRHQDGSGRSHNHGRQQMARFNALRDVHCHDAAGDMGHAAGHNCHQFAASGARKKRPDGERSFSLAHEDACSYVHAFRSGDAHRLEHDPRHAPNDDLHDADVIEHCEERRDEDNCGQNLKRKNRAPIRTEHRPECSGIWQTEFSEQHLGAGEGCGKHVGDHVAGPVHKALAKAEAQHQEREAHLQTESPDNGPPANVLAVGGAEPCGKQNSHYSKQPRESSQGTSLLKAAFSYQPSALSPSNRRENNGGRASDLGLQNHGDECSVPKCAKLLLH
jgi:hypothetical protein